MIDRIGQLKITVAVCTRQRPKMLEAVLASWNDMSLPEGCDVRFLVVENDETDRSGHVVEAALAGFAHGPIGYALETEPGIPFARNRAAKEAIEGGSDLLAFIDDDETVARDWLVKLVNGYRNSKAVLLGAPLRTAPAEKGLPFWQSKMHECIAARYFKKERRAAQRADLDGTDGVTIVTNNWLAELDLFRDRDIWFDEAMRYTGGTDAKFYHEVVEAGLPTAWVKDAFAYEFIPAERLSFSYQYGRGRDQSNTNFNRKIDRSPLVKFSVIVSVPAKVLASMVLAVMLPFTNGRTLLDLSRTLGWIAGRIGALFGHKSSLYLKTTGY